MAEQLSAAVAATQQQHQHQPQQPQPQPVAKPLPPFPQVVLGGYQELGSQMAEIRDAFCNGDAARLAARGGGIPLPMRDMYDMTRPRDLGNCTSKIFLSRLEYKTLLGEVVELRHIMQRVLQELAVFNNENGIGRGTPMPSESVQQTLPTMEVDDNEPGPSEEELIPRYTTAA